MSCMHSPRMDALNLNPHAWCSRFPWESMPHRARASHAQGNKPMCRQLGFESTRRCLIFKTWNCEIWILGNRIASQNEPDSSGQSNPGGQKHTKRTCNGPGHVQLYSQSRRWLNPYSPGKPPGFWLMNSITGRAHCLRFWKALGILEGCEQVFASAIASWRTCCKSTRPA